MGFLWVADTTRWRVHSLKLEKVKLMFYLSKFISQLTRLKEVIDLKLAK